jgi:L-alanine-DL-glutamate epimerase-like enolase superfamily enzyme
MRPGKGTLLSGYRITRFQFARERPIGDSQIRLDQVHVAALELVDEAGRTGLGFAQSLVTPLPDVDEIERVFAQEAWPALVGQTPVALALSVRRARGGNVRQMGLPFEKGLQDGVWDLLAKQIDLPLWRMLGAERQSLPVYASGLDFHLTDHEFEELFGNAAEQGYRAFKIKVGHSDIGRDLHRLALLRRATGGRGAVMIDANEAWTAQEASDAIQIFQREGQKIFWAEDPVPRDDFGGLQMLRRLGLTRINAGEYLDLGGKRRLLESRACDMLNIHGPIGDGMRVGWLANDCNVEVTLGNTFLEIGVNLALALPGVRWLEYSFQNLDHLVEATFEIADGFIHARDIPGHGLELSETARRNSQPKLEPLQGDEPGPLVHG